MPKKNEIKPNPRAAELKKMLPAAEGTKADILIEELVFLEERLTELKKLPFLKVHPQHPERQKATPAARQYKEYLQQYNNSLKLFLKLCGDLGDANEESPLRAWLRSKEEEDE